MNQSVKEELFQLAKAKLQNQMTDIEEQLKTLDEDGESEEKSSAGDKYETGREMLKQNQEMFSMQLQRAKNQLAHLKSISTKVQEVVAEGALVEIEGIGHLWISIGLGPISLQGVQYQLVSTDSPLFEAAQGKKENDTFLLRDKSMKIKSVQ